MVNLMASQASQAELSEDLAVLEIVIDSELGAKIIPFYNFLPQHRFYFGQKDRASADLKQTCSKLDISWLARTMPRL